jgi:tetratricopeptide (TPR) repeat protein
VIYAPGDVLAERYRMIARIGRGGMSDVWRAHDLVLGAPVALKFMQAPSPETRARILNEVRLARQITHPAVCRVFDVGEAAGDVFLSMELVDGEDLAALIHRAGRLPSEKVIDIARQLCAGLAAAHARGVLHRDLKPANVLIDDQGRVRITDFGIAVTRTDAPYHTLVGTPGYMAPEQLTQGTPLTEQSDLYALGLVLYELIVGRHPLETRKSGRPQPPSALISDVNPALERVVLQALSEDPRQRPASAAAMAASLSTDAAPERGRSRRWLLVSAGVLAIAAAMIGATFVVPRGRPSLSPQDTIVIADFVNTTGEPVFDGALKVALAVALEQSPFLKVFGEERVRETLRLMERRPEEPVTRSIAREVARREHLKALLVGSIAKLGANYVLTLEALNAESGDSMARQQIEVPNQESVLGALGRIAVKLRETLGESLASIQKFDAPLPKATTTSLEALHAYALGLDEGRLNPTREAIAQLKRAIELDPDFAMAQAMLSGLYANMSQSALAPEFSTRAFALRDRVSEYERFYISWRYHRDATQSWDQALELARSWAATYPRDSSAFNSLGFAAVTLGQFESAIEPLREAIRLDPKSFAPPENLAIALVALNRIDDATAVLREARARQKFFYAQARVSFLIAFLQNDTATMERLRQEALLQSDPTSAANWQPRVSAFSGRLRAAHDGFREAVRVAMPYRLDEVAARYGTQDAESHAIVGQCEDARREVDPALRLSRDNFTLERASRVLALCDAPSEAARLVEELARRFPDATLTTGIARPVTAAILAWRQGDPAGALGLLEPVRIYDHLPAAEFWPAFVRGHAYLQLKDAARASQEFQSILDRRGQLVDAPLYPLAQLGRARAAVLSNDLVLARRKYQDLFALWKDADPDLEPLVDARREHAALQ